MLDERRLEKRVRRALEPVGRRCGVEFDLFVRQSDPTVIELRVREIWPTSPPACRRAIEAAVQMALLRAEGMR